MRTSASADNHTIFAPIFKNGEMNREEEDMKRFNICKTDSVFILGKHLPKGAMYGVDDKGVWACVDYRAHNIFDLSKAALATIAEQVGINVEEMELHAPVTRRLLIGLLKKERSLYKKPQCMSVRNESGKFETVMVKSAEAVPLLALSRPAKRDMLTGDGYENRTKWVRSIEFGVTVNKILELVERFPERTQIERAQNNNRKIVPVVVDGEIRLASVPSVSKTQAEMVAGNPDGRGIKEFMPHAVMHGLTKPHPKDHAIPTGNYVDLEKLAAEQRAAAKPAKPCKKPAVLVDIYPGMTLRREKTFRTIL